MLGRAEEVTATGGRKGRLPNEAVQMGLDAAGVLRAAVYSRGPH